MCTGYKPWKNRLNMWRNLEKSRLKVDKIDRQIDFKSILGWSISGLSPAFSVFHLYFVHDKHVGIISVMFCLLLWFCQNEWKAHDDESKRWVVNAIRLVFAFMVIKPEQHDW